MALLVVTVANPCFSGKAQRPMSSPGDEPVTVTLDKQLPNGPWKANLSVTSGLLYRARTGHPDLPHLRHRRDRDGLRSRVCLGRWAEADGRAHDQAGERDEKRRLSMVTFVVVGWCREPVYDETPACVGLGARLGVSASRRRGRRSNHQTTVRAARSSSAPPTHHHMLMPWSAAQASPWLVAVSITAPSNAGNLGSRSNSVGATTISGQLGQVQVTDSRGAPQGSGWTATSISTAFTPTAGPAIRAGFVGYTATWNPTIHIAVAANMAAGVYTATHSVS